MVDQVDQLTERFALVFFYVDIAVIVESLAFTQAVTAFPHVAFGNVRYFEPVGVECLAQVIARVVENVVAAPVDKFDQTDDGETQPEPDAERLVQFLCRGDTFFNGPRGF